MLPRTLLVGAVLSAAAPAVAAEPAPPPSPGSEPPPYTEWHGRGHEPPVGPAPLPAPPPDVGAPEYARRTVELVPSVGVAVPNCRAGDVSDDRCDGVTTGGGVGFTGLWRVTPYFAWGGGFEIVGFAYDPPRELQLRNAGAGAVWLGLVGRAYFLEEGSLDPYLQLGIGVGALGTSAEDRAGVTWEETGAGSAASLGGGLDVHLGRSVKLGPALTYTRVFVDKIRRCRASGDGDCVDLPKDGQGHLNSYLALSARLSFVLGGEH